MSYDAKKTYTWGTRVFTRGPPPHYWLGPTMFDCADRTGCGKFIVVWPQMKDRLFVCSYRASTIGLFRLQTIIHHNLHSTLQESIQLKSGLRWSSVFIEKTPRFQTQKIDSLYERAFEASCGKDWKKEAFIITATNPEV